MTALSRTLLRLTCGLPPDPDDAEEVGRIFDAAVLYAPTPPAPESATDPSARVEGGTHG